MAQLAILGHATRHKEVIKILRMLGGKISMVLVGDLKSCGYYINSDGFIDYKHRSYFNNYIIYTLEEFLEKFPYKVGDKVYNIVHNENQTITNLVWDFQENEVVYKTNNNEYVYVNYLQPYKEETMENKPNLLQQLKEYFENTPQEVIETEWHEYAKYNEIGPSVEEYLEYVNNIRQPQYPKTYEECCNVIGCDSKMVLGTMPVRYNTLVKLEKLLICRDAYWKIAGEQMGLGKPWEPYWTIYKQKFCLGTDKDKVIEECVTTGNRILAFPTKEMRDAFYENFKELIEECKELL